MNVVMSLAIAWDASESQTHYVKFSVNADYPWMLRRLARMIDNGASFTGIEDAFVSAPVFKFTSKLHAMRFHAAAVRIEGGVSQALHALANEAKPQPQLQGFKL